MSDLDDEEHDFQDPVAINTKLYTRKRIRITEASQKYVPTDSDLEEATLCTLCQMPWNNNGTHATVNLKCGHVFGRSCIQKYIKESITEVKIARCPVCDQIVTKSEPRRIWATKVVPCDEDDLQELKKEHVEADAILQSLIEKRQHLDHEIQKIKEQLNMYNSEDMLKKKIEMQSLPQVRDAQLDVQQPYTLESKFSLPNEKYRVLDLIPDRDMAVVSVTNSTTKTFGIRKVNLCDPTITEFIPNHAAQIKDVKHALTNNMILSTGFDKTLKLTSILTKQVVQTYQLDAPGWSCATNPSEPNLIYCGVTNNRLLVFDIRNTKGSVQTLTEPGPKRNMSPIHSVEVFENRIICANLSHSYYWTAKEDGRYEYKMIDGHMNSLFDNTEYKNFAMTFHDQALLTSSRSKTSCRYHIAHFESGNLVMDWSYDYEDQKQMSMPRNTIYSRNEETHLCLADSDTVRIRDKNDLLQSIKVDNHVLDIKCIGKQNLLTILTENNLQVYRCTRVPHNK